MHQISKTKENAGITDYKLPFPKILPSFLLCNPFSFIAEEKMRAKRQEGRKNKRRGKRGRKNKSGEENERRRREAHPQKIHDQF